MHSSTSGFALHSFVALAEDTKNTAGEQYLKRIQARLREAIINPESSASAARPASRTLKQFLIEPVVAFSQSNSDYTTMEVIARDQPGLLRKVAVCLRDHKIAMINARIATFGERAEDVFFITNLEGYPIKDSERLDKLATAICADLKRKTRAPRTPSK